MIMTYPHFPQISSAKSMDITAPLVLSHWLSILLGSHTKHSQWFRMFQLQDPSTFHGKTCNSKHVQIYKSMVSGYRFSYPTNPYQSSQKHAILQVYHSPSFPMSPAGSPGFWQPGRRITSESVARNVPRCRVLHSNEIWPVVTGGRCLRYTLLRSQKSMAIIIRYRYRCKFKPWWSIESIFIGHRLVSYLINDVTMMWDIVLAGGWEVWMEVSWDGDSKIVEVIGNCPETSIRSLIQKGCTKKA